MDFDSGSRREAELFAECVVPACKQLNAGRDSSIDWVGDHHDVMFGAMQQATREAIARYKDHYGTPKAPAGG